MKDAPVRSIDCLIIGGGPAGLTAAIYLARFHLETLVIDRGGGRARMIPCTHNHAGFPGGISGNDLIDRMAAQASSFGARIEMGEVTQLAGAEGDSAGGFIATIGGEALHARTVLLATGVRNIAPAMPADLHDRALACGLLRYCPVCDGFEITDRRIAVIGTGAHGAREAIFVRGFTRDVSLIAERGPHLLSPEDRAALIAAEVAIIDGPIAGYAIRHEQIALSVAAGDLAFDSIYPALGSIVHADLGIAAGARATDQQCLIVDEHQRTSIPNLYAAGDVVIGLDQISNAMGQAGVAATTIRNDLAARMPILR